MTNTNTLTDAMDRHERQTAAYNAARQADYAVQQELIKTCIIDVPVETELNLTTVTAAIMADTKAAKNVNVVAAKLNRTPDEIASLAAIMACNEIDADKTEEESLENSVYIDAAIETARSAVLKMLVDNHLLAIKLQAEVDATKKTNKKTDKTVVLHPIQHAFLKDIVDRCKVYRDAAGNPVPERVPDESGKLKSNPAAVSYTIEAEKNPIFNSFSDVESKITDIVSWFKPNAGKTGKSCQTDNADAMSIIKKAYKRAIRLMAADLPEYTDDLDAKVPADKAGA